jgi:hypothetical protein
LQIQEVLPMAVDSSSRSPTSRESEDDKHKDEIDVLA